MTRTSFADGPNLRPLARAWGLPRAGALGAARANVGAFGAAVWGPVLDSNRARIVSQRGPLKVLDSLCERSSGTVRIGESVPTAHPESVRKRLPMRSQI